MEGAEIDLELQENNFTKQEKRPNIFKEALEIRFNRFDDPRNCQTLEDIVGKKIEGRVSKARRLDWAPRKMDITRIAETIKIIQEKQNSAQPLKIVDIAGHSGFLDRLILDEADSRSNEHANLIFTVVDPDKTVTRAGSKYYQEQFHEPRINFRTETSQQFANRGEQADVVICSWMRPEMDLRPDIEKLNPKIIIFVKDVNGDVGKPESFENNQKYEQSASWLGFSGHDIDTYNSNLRSLTESTNIVLIMTKKGGEISGEDLRNDLGKIKVEEPDKYSWEKQLPSINVGAIHEDDEYDFMHPHLRG